LLTAIETHVRGADSDDLDGVAERVLTAGTVEEALGVSRIWGCLVGSLL
jgi:hypothetical protein